MVPISPNGTLLNIRIDCNQYRHSRQQDCLSQLPAHFRENRETIPCLRSPDQTDIFNTTMIIDLEMENSDNRRSNIFFITMNNHLATHDNDDDDYICVECEETVQTIINTIRQLIIELEQSSEQSPFDLHQSSKAASNKNSEAANSAVFP